MTDICSVLSLSAEILTTHASLLSVLRAKSAAEALGVTVDVVIVADCPGTATREYLSKVSGLGVRSLETNVGDVGLARNAALAVTDAPYLSFLKSDRICSDNWLIRVHDKARSETRTVIWHPEAVLSFGGGHTPSWRLCPDMDFAIDDWMRLALTNLWPSGVFGRRELFVGAPFPKEGVDGSYACEDWAWNMETIAQGMIHKTVHGAVHLHRRRPDTTCEAAHGLTPGSNLFDRKFAQTLSR